MNTSVALELTILMPCLNEAKTIEICIQKALQFLARAGVHGEVLVADNGSTDGSRQKAIAAGARVVQVENKGYGAALLGGLNAARGHYIIMGDADDSYDFSALDGFVEELRKGADLVMGNRFRGGIAPKAMPALHRYLGNPVLSFIGRLLYRTDIGDFHCGLRGFSRQRISELQLKSSGMEFASEMVMKACMSHYNVVEVSTTLMPDGRGRPPHLNTWRDGWRHLKLLLSYGPDHLFIAPALVFLSVGLVLLCALAGGPLQVAGFYFGAHFLALGSLLSLVGINVLVFGILAKLVAVKKITSISTGMTNYFFNHFKLEHGLMLGGGLFGVGCSINGVLLYRWIAYSGQAMDDTIHTAFFAGTLIAIGFCIALASFLVALLVDKD